MGLLDNFAKRVANEITKAPGIPVNAVPMTMTQLQNPSNNNSGVGTFNPLPRNEIAPTVPFGPANPLIPAAINPTDPETGRPDPRRFEYQVAQNINVTETRLIPFITLRSAADQIDILRKCIEVLKAKITSMDWDITLGEDSAEKIVAEIGGTQIRAMTIARERYTKEIDRVRAFWENPDKANGLTFSDWLNTALEEILVIDALAIWPQKSVSGDLFGLQILDGSTIKPLIDDRGMRPTSPNPAFQQILYGFPRSEFSASIEDEIADGEFSSDELSYIVRNRRTTSVYGYSPTERALPVADIYLRRQQWLRAEFTDGVTPELLMATDANFGNNPNLLLAYENVFNNDLAGQTEQRKRVRLLPTGMTPIQLNSYDAKFKETLDEYLINSVCGHYGVMPSEIGFSPKGGLGGAGHQKGQADSSDVIGVKPLANWLEKILTNLCYTYLGMPRELEFKFMDTDREDKLTIAQVRDMELKNGGITVNEMRSESGRSLIDSPEADSPMIITTQGAFMLTPTGLVPFDTALNGEFANQQPAQVSIDTPDTIDSMPAPEPEEAQKAQQEVKRFLRWVKKSPDRPFNFQEVPTVYAEVLNKFVSVKDYDSARWYAERYLA